MSGSHAFSIETGDPERELFHFGTGGAIRRSEMSLTALRKAGEEGGLILARMTAAGPDDLHADKWEIHPDGDEFIHILEGEAGLIVEEAEGERRALLVAGDAAIVPRGRWHRFEWKGPVSLLFVTPPGRTELKDAG